METRLKKILANNIYNIAKLEGCNIKLPNTQTILNGVNVGNVKMQDIEVNYSVLITKEQV